MLFVSNPPVKIQVENDRRIIVLTQSKIMFTHLDFIQEYLAMPLISANPETFYYSPETSQTLVKFSNSFEIYYCDWKTQIKLIKVQLWQRGSIEAIFYDKKSGWNIIGDITQYDSFRIRFSKVNPADRPQGILNRCYVGNTEYILTKQQLLKRQKLNNETEVNWRDRMMVLKNENYEIEMIGAQSADKMRDLLCVNKKYTLVIKNNEATFTVEHPNTFFIENSLLINEATRKNFMTFHYEKTHTFSDLGTIELPKGKIISSYLYQNELVLFMYDKKQINIHTIPLVSDEQHKPNHQPRKILSGSISKIVEASNEDMSQYLINFPGEEKKEKVRFVEADDADFNKEDSIRSDMSEVISRKGGDEDQNDIQLNQKEKLSGSIPLDENKQQNSSVNLENSKMESVQNFDKIRNKHHKSSSKLDHFHHSQDNIDDAVETPGFGFNGDGWGSVNEKWGELQPNRQILEDEQIEEQSQIFDEDTGLIASVPGIPTKKVEYFKPRNIPLTQQMVEQIESTPYHLLVERICQDEPEKFNDIAYQFMHQLLQESDNSGQLFAKYIRTFNPEYTKDKIKRLFKVYKDKQIYKTQITNILKYFKLSEVPLEMLKFPKQFSEIVKTLQKELLVADLLEPTEDTITKILQNYFKTHFTEEGKTIPIEDEYIDISLPRNMLNVLLYLNNVLNLPIQSIFSVYCHKLIIQNRIGVLHKIIQGKIFDICNVNLSILDNQIINVFIDQITNRNTDQLWELIECMSPEYYDQYRLKLAVATQLNKNDIFYPSNQLLGVTSLSVNIYMFLDTIISENSCKNLMNVNFETVYQSLYWLQQGFKIRNQTNQYIALIKTLAEKYCQTNNFSQAFKTLKSIRFAIKKSFVAYLLYKYANSKFINRLIDSSLDEIEITFKEFFTGKQTNIGSLPRDQIIASESSQCFSIPWASFIQIYQENMDTFLEISYLTFMDLNCAYQLFQRMDELKKTKFQNLFIAIESYITIEIDDMNQNDESINPKGETPFFFQQDCDYVEVQENMASSNYLQQQQQLCDFGEKNFTSRSMNIIEHYKRTKEVNPKANSQKKASDQSFMKNQDFARLKILVHKKEVYGQLENIFKKYDIYMFIKALKMVDLQKNKLHYIDQLRAIVNQHPDYPITRILTFQFFTISNPDNAFIQIQSKIKAEINLNNFWIIYMIIQILLNKGIQVGKIFIKKLIQYFQNDELSTVVKELISVTGLGKQTQFIKNMGKLARQYQLFQIASVLNI